jgi:NAD(P)-dependent dehydrogenase (short-subunit alcohol dehydrogenase family)
MSKTRYSGKAVVITGAASGLGAAMANRFAAEGAKLALLDIDGKSAETRAEEFRAENVEAFCLRVDVADNASIQAAAAEVERRFGRCDVLCPNVGVQQFGAIDVLTEKDWQWVMSVNFHGVINTVNAFLPLLRQAESTRHIVLTASASVFQIGIRMGAYIASKYAVVGYGTHLQSSIAARPAEFGASRFEMADVEMMIQDAGIDPAKETASAEYATRNLLDNLDQGHPYIITHGSYLPQVEAQQQKILAAFAHMAANP